MKRCIQAVAAAFLVLLGLAVFLDDPIFLVCAVSLALSIVWRYLVFYKNVSALAISVECTRTLEKTVIRQGVPIRVTTVLSLIIPDTLNAEYQDTLSPGIVLDQGEIQTPLLPAGSHTVRLQYQVIPFIHGNYEFPGGILMIQDRFFEMHLVVSGRTYRGPVLKVQPNPLIQRVRTRNEFGGREVERISAVHGYSIRMYRDYLPGDDIRHVDWKLSAKHESLIVREYAGVESFVPLIIVDLPDREQECDMKGFSVMVGAVTALIDRSLKEKSGTSLLIISGPNVIDMIYGEHNRARFMTIIRERLHPQVRHHHMYRLTRRSTIRERIRSFQPQVPGEDRETSDEFHSRMIRIMQKHLVDSATPHFSAQIARILASLHIEDIYLYSLCSGDISHIQEIAFQARRLHFDFRVRTPHISDEPRLHAVFRMMRGEIIEGIS